MPERGPDISVVLIAHNEGRLAHRTMRSLLRSVEYAGGKGVSMEVVVVLDRPDSETELYFSRYEGRPDISVRTADYGDPGLARNYGVRGASGRYIALMDADNLFSKDWLYKAYSYLEERGRDVIAHPEYHIIFGAQNSIWRQISSADPRFRYQDLLQYNAWDTVCMAKKEILLKYPHQPTHKDSGFGFEDWHFNCETLADGIEHHVVPSTVHFLRRKGAGSRMAFDVGSNRVIRPTRLFEPETLAALVEERNKKSGPVRGPEEKDRERISLTHRLRLVLASAVRRMGRPINAFAAVLLRVSPGLHGLARRVLDTFIPPPQPLSLPEWLMAEWREIHGIEPQLFPERDLLPSDKDSPWNVPRSSMGDRYLELCSLYPADASHVILVPWLTRGGADLVALNYVNALVEDHTGRNIVVIATLNADSPWAARLPEGVRFIEFGKICSNLTREEREKLLATLLVQMSPGVVHNINSDLGYKVFVKYGKALKSISRLYTTSFCKDVTMEGRSVGYPFKYLPECFDYLRALSFDNTSFKEELREIYAFDPAKLFVHYQPIDCAERRGYRDRVAEKGRLDILWAGRIDRQKRPDILLRIAAACIDMPFRFHVYGTPILDDDNYLKNLEGIKNITCYGVFDGLSSLPIEEYDLFLYTSQWDGLPTILFDATMLGLPIVASDVGAVGEFITSEKTGFLINPYDDVQVYVECLKRIYADRSTLPGVVDKAYELLRTRHSWEGFVERLKEFPDYLAVSSERRASNAGSTRG